MDVSQPLSSRGLHGICSAIPSWAPAWVMVMVMLPEA